jgi:hypothetical protein
VIEIISISSMEIETDSVTVRTSDTDTESGAACGALLLEGDARGERDGEASGVNVAEATKTAEAWIANHRANEAEARGTAVAAILAVTRSWAEIGDADISLKRPVVEKAEVG